MEPSSGKARPGRSRAACSACRAVKQVSRRAQTWCCCFEGRHGMVQEGRRVTVLIAGQQKAKHTLLDSFLQPKSVLT